MSYDSSKSVIVSMSVLLVVSGLYGGSIRASADSAPTNSPGPLVSLNCDTSLFWDGFDYHIGDTVVCVSGEVFDATGEGGGCGELGRCRVFLEEGANVTFLDGSALHLGRKMTQTSANSSLTFDGYVEIQQIVHERHFDVRGKVRIANHSHAEMFFVFDYYVLPSGTLEVDNSVISHPDCPCIYPEGGELVISGSEFFDTENFIYRRWSDEPRGSILFSNNYIGPLSDSFVWIVNQDVVIEDVLVYNTDEAWGADVFDLQNCNATIDNVTFAGSRYYSSWDILAMDSMVIATRIRNENFSYVDGDPLFYNYNRFWVYGQYIQYNPNNYIIADIEGEKTCPPGTTGTFKFYNDGTTYGSKPIVETIEPCRAVEEDTDGDGLLDSWESSGIDSDGDGTIDLDLPSLGADPLHKDFFVEVDAMTGRAPANLMPVVDAFAAVPHSLVNNPDGKDGISLHLELDESNITLQDFPNKWDDFDPVKDAHFGSVAQRADPNWDHIRMAKAKVYRYALFAN
ncbi:MAG: hypothetical protein ACE5KV_07050, partial [Thermoplasmata archaeon]